MKKKKKLWIPLLCTQQRCDENNLQQQNLAKWINYSKEEASSTKRFSYGDKNLKTNLNYRHLIKPTHPEITIGKGKKKKQIQELTGNQKYEKEKNHQLAKGEEKLPVRNK